MRQSTQSLIANDSEKDWMRLSKLTLCRLILFNKRRPAEVKELKVEDFIRRPKWKEQQEGEFAMALSESDRLLADRMDMVISAGKSRKNVDAYVLLPPDAKHAIELLIERRGKFTKSSNKFLFARLHSDTPLTGHTDLKEIVAECPDLKFPERITSTSLRKYIATVSQILDMTDAELEMLANHLGHDVKTHKENYRLSHSTRELTVVSQLLFAVENGYVNTFKGKHLSSISVNDLPDVLDSMGVKKPLVVDEADISSGEDFCVQPADLDENPDSVKEKASTFENTGTLNYSGAVEGNTDSGSSGGNTGSGSGEGNTVSEEGNTGSEEGNTVSEEGNTGSAEVDSVTSKGKRKRTAWSQAENNLLRKKFKSHLIGNVSSVHQADLREIQKLLPLRTLPQLRSKINNMRHGKSK